MSERRLAAIMFTDIVGYTGLMGSDEDMAFEVLVKNREIHSKLIEQFNGTLIKEMGDGMLISFHLASDAVRCAIEIQKACKEQNIPLKIGIHEGELVFEGADVFGDGVNIASRLQDDAPEGCITISGSVYRDIKNKSTIKTEFLKEKRYKNVDEPIKVYKVYCEEEEPVVNNSKHPAKRNFIPYLVLAGLSIGIAIMLLWQFLPSTDQEKSAQDAILDKSIAVIPFWNDSPDPDNAYFCSGMEEEIRIHLLKIADLKIESRQSVEKYRENPDIDVTTIGKELNVAFVVEGSVQKIENDIRIRVQLIDAKSGDHIWAEKYDGDYNTKLLDFQSNTAKQIASSLNTVLSPEEERIIEQFPTKNIKAYDFYLKGTHENNSYWRTLDKNHLKKALYFFDKALEADPDFVYPINGKGGVFMAYQNYDSALYYADKLLSSNADVGAYQLKGECYWFLGKYDLSIENYLKFIRSIPKDNISWIHVALGRAYSFQKNGMIDALPYLEKGLLLNEESLPTVYNTIGSSFTNIGLYEKAEEYGRRSLQLTGGCISVGFYSWTLAVQSKYQDALSFLDSICGLNNCEAICHKYKFHIYLANKDFEQADYHVSELSKTGITLDQADRYWYKQYIGDSLMIAYLYKELGREKESLIITNNSIQSLETLLSQNEIWWTYLFLSFAYAIQENNEKTLMYLRMAQELGLQWGWHDLIQTHPIFENLRDDPEFKTLVKKAQDEKAAIRAQVKEMEERGELDL